MKHNVLLVSGEHYSKTQNKYRERVKKTSNISNEQKIRLTKNHIGKCMRIYQNNILSYSPGATVFPRTENMHDQMNAELSRSAWEYIRETCNYKRKVRLGVKNYVELGEVWLKQMYDVYGGKLLGYEPQLDEYEQPILDEMGKAIPDKEKPVYEGKHINKLIKSYDIFRDKNAIDLEESEFIGVRSLVVPETLYEMIEKNPKINDKEKAKLKEAVKKSSNSQYQTFNGVAMPVDYSEGLCLLKEFYFRESPKYPEGYYYFVCEGEIIFEGVLQKDAEGNPIFPLTYALCDEFDGSPRGFSPMKQGRPIQSEINRTASKIAETQITLGDDKVVTSYGGGLTEGDKLAGVRQLKVLNPNQYTVIPGRSGGQYYEYMESQISELYKVLDVIEDTAERQAGNDIQQTLYHSLKNKKKFTFYSDKIEQWLVEWCKKDIALAKAYWRDDIVVRAVGKNEQINIPEFKGSDSCSYDIKVLPMTDDIESTMGKYMVFRDLMQYSKPDEIAVGKIAEQMPFIDGKYVYSHMTLPEREVKNLLLALDRGEMPSISKFDNNENIIAGITRRMREEDFKFLVEKNPIVFQNYMKQYEERTEVLRKRVQEERDANAGTIPTGGPQIKVDMYVTDPKNPNRSVRATVDQTSMMWFLKRVGEQGQQLEVLNDLGHPQARIDAMKPPQRDFNTGNIVSMPPNPSQTTGNI